MAEPFCFVLVLLFVGCVVSLQCGRPHAQMPTGDIWGRSSCVARHRRHSAEGGCTPLSGAPQHNVRNVQSRVCKRFPRDHSADTFCSGGAVVRVDVLGI